MAKQKSPIPVNPFVEWMETRKFSVDDIYKKTKKNKVVRNTLYKLTSEQEVSQKKIREVLSVMRENLIISRRLSERLFVKIVIWRELKEYRGKMSELISLLED